jgi:hypothetical protein
MRSQASLRNRARQVFLLVSAYALMAVGAPLAGAVTQPCPMHEHGAGAPAAQTALPAAHDAMPPCHQAALDAQAAEAAKVPGAGDHHAPAQGSGDCCQSSPGHHCSCNFAAAAALPTLALAFAPAPTPVFSARWSTTARNAEPPGNLLRPPIR